jgi:DNA primase
MGHIPQESIEAVLAATDIVDLIGSHLQLRRAGSSYKALCPFHPEKTPSFHVNPARNTFHCFGCGAGGSAIRFVMDYENVPFPEAVKRLAARAGIQLAADLDDAEEESRARSRRRLVQLHQAIADWFHSLLTRDPAGAPARRYLETRGVSDATASEWKLGFAPEGTAAYRDWAQSHGFSAREMVAAGILALRDEARPDGGTYPRFRARLMFPVANDYGDTIAFSGRLLVADAKAAKYINSPETPVFNKGKTFFGLDRAKRPVLKAGHAIICEGQLDLITCATAGIDNIVAPLGTALTDDHARLLARYTREVVLCYDADAAGFKAAERAFATLAKHNLDVRVATPPPGEDPDSLVRRAGAEAFRSVLAGARPFFEFQIERGAATLDLASIKDRVAFANALADNIAHLTDPIATDTAVHQVATRLKLPPAELRELVRARRQKAASRPAGATRRRPNTAPDAAPGESATPEIGNRTLVALCRLALTDPACHEWMRHPERLRTLSDVPESDLLLQLLSRQPDPASPSPAAALLAGLPPAEERYLSRLIERAIAGSGLPDAKVYFLDLELASLKRRLDALQGAITAPSTASLQEIIQLKARMLEVKRSLASPTPLPG